MSELDKITVEKNPTCFPKENKKELEIQDVIDFFIDKRNDKKGQIISGRVYQKNKKIKPLETIFKLLEEEVNKIDSKNNKDLDNSFFNLNKKILSSNIYNLKEIINLYNIDEDRIVNFLIGTLMQSIYDEKDR